MHAGEAVEEPAQLVARLRDRVTRDLSTNRTALTTLHAGQALLQATSEIGDRSPQAALRDCRAGCSACCYLTVAILPLEAVVMADGIRGCCGPDQLHDTIRRVADVSARVSNLTIEQRAQAKIPCALLGNDGACTIHPFRPIGCRGWTSFDRGACEAALHAEQPGHGGPQDHWNFTVAGCATEALQDACRELGLEAGHRELHAALLIALRTPDAAARFAAGESLFDECPGVTSDRLRA